MSKILDSLESENNVVLYAQDECSVKVEPTNQRSWSPIGISPILEKNGSHEGVNLIGATEILKNFDTVVDVYPSKQTINSGKVIDFLQKLIDINPDKKVYVIWDNAGSHTGEETRCFLQLHQDELEVINLPPYSPDMNPQENLWNNLKTTLFRVAARSSIDELIFDIYNIYNEYNSNSKLVSSLVPARKFLA